MNDARVGRLATVDPHGNPHVVPCTFVVLGDTAYTAVDHKPKTTQRLQRLANIEANPVAELLVDHWDEDWSRLWWVRLRGRARILGTDHPEAVRAVDALVAKYEQYADHRPAGPVIAIDVEARREWAATPG